MVKKTSSSPKSLTLGGLRKALEHIKACARTMTVSEFQKEYKKVFHKQISPKQAKEYMQSLKASQKGGMAPLEYETRPGADLPHGSYPQYLSGGFGFANQNSVIGDNAGHTAFPSPATDLGSNLVKGGGKRRRVTVRRKAAKGSRKRVQRGGSPILDTIRSNVTEMTNRPFLATGIPGIGNDAQLLAHGAAGFPSPRPELHSPHLPATTMGHTMHISPASKIV